jgi:predicted RNA binding protein YcfA (HicA-like mRNA interferase family)
MALPSVTPRRELVRKFKSLGFEGPLQGSRHSFMRKGTLNVRIPNGDCHVSLLTRILKQAGISREEWLDA